MARIRTVKPELFLHEDMAEMPIYARMLFIGLFTLADRRGRLEDRPRRIKASIFPYDDIDINQLLNNLDHGGFIIRYLVDGIPLIQVVSFEKHQHCHVREPESTFPPVPEPVLQHAETAKENADTGLAPGLHGAGTSPAGKEGEGEGEREGNKNKTHQQQRALVAEVDGPALTEQVFQRCFEQNEVKIREMFPGVDFELERAKCLANYRGRQPTVDPLLLVFKWFERSRSGKKAVGNGMMGLPSPVVRKQAATFEACRRFVEKRRSHDQGG